jgi:hypothetical protein
MEYKLCTSDACVYEDGIVDVEEKIITSRAHISCTASPSNCKIAVVPLTREVVVLKLKVWGAYLEQKFGKKAMRMSMCRLEMTRTRARPELA